MVWFSLLSSFLISHATSAPTFQCTAGSFTLTVEADQPSSTFNYAVHSAVTSQPWLEGGSLAILSNGSYLIPGAGLTPTGPAQLGSGADDLGPYTYCSIPWATTTGPQGGTPFVANFSCYEEHIGFALHFPIGYSPSTPAQTALPATHFPQFKTTASTLSSPTMSFVEWAGEMDTYGNQHGVGLQGYRGGVESGPLLLFNNSQLVLGESVPQALVLGPGGGPGTHVAHGVLRVVRDPSSWTTTTTPTPPCSRGTGKDEGEGQEDLSCYYAPHTDKVGGDSSPGTAGGVLVAAGNASACCAACAALGGGLCDSWVYDTDGTAGGANCWPLLGTTGSKQGMGDRDFGLAPSAAPPCGTPTLDSAPATFTPSPGWEAGVGASTPAACCRLCGTLGAGVCTSWVLLPNSTTTTTSSGSGSGGGGGGGTGLCIPLLNASSALKPSPGAQYGAIQALPSVLAAGVQGRIASFPPRFSSVWWLAGSGGGANDAVMAYGWALRKVAGLQRLDKALDPQRNLLSWWSDNGAYYFDGYWPKFFNATSHTAQDVFLALKAYHGGLGLTVGTYQMDPWWYGGSCGASGPPPPQCHNAAAWPWSANWSAAPGFFPAPGGLAALGLPLTLYSNNYAQAPLNAMGGFEWVNCSTCTGGVPPYARVAVAQSYAFHSYIFDVGAGWGMNAFEVDFADFMFEGFADFASDVRAFDAYWEGVNRASREHAFPTQLCMSLPAITLSTPQWSHVTNARLQGDGYVTNAARYDIFQTSLLYAALELAPFLDNVWTVGCQPSWDNAYGNATCEPHSQGLIAIATLSSGPVGFGDGLGFTNATLLNMTCRSDGVLLQPSLPAVNLEAFFVDALKGGGAGARITNAPSFIPTHPPAAAAAAAPPTAAVGGPYPRHFRTQPPPGSQVTFLTLFATFVGADTRVAPVDLWWGGGSGNSGNSSSGGGLYAQQLSRAGLCVEGRPAVASGCATLFPVGGSPTDTLLTINTGPSSHDLWSLSPVFPSGGGTGGGWGVLGELAKFTRHSPERILWIDPGCSTTTSTTATSSASGGATFPSLCLQAVGGAGEAVQLAFVDPVGVVRMANVVLDSQGGAAVACTCSGPSDCACVGGPPKRGG